jgi:hypothetical protein
MLDNAELGRASALIGVEAGAFGSRRAHLAPDFVDGLLDRIEALRARVIGTANAVANLFGFFQKSASPAS